MTRYAIVIHKANGNYSAHVADVDGCIATGATLEETTANLREALELHFEAMAEEGEPIPPPNAVVDFVDVKVPSVAKRKSA